MGTVRDRSELGAALRARAAHIEVRGALAQQVIRARAAAAIAALALLVLVMFGLYLAGTAALHQAAPGLAAMRVLPVVLALLTAAGALLVAVRDGGAAAFATLRAYREVHRSHGVLVLRRS